MLHNWTRGKQNPSTFLGPLGGEKEFRSQFYSAKLVNKKTTENAEIVTAAAQSRGFFSHLFVHTQSQAIGLSDSTKILGFGLAEHKPQRFEFCLPLTWGCSNRFPGHQVNILLCVLTARLSHPTPITLKSQRLEADFR